MVDQLFACAAAFFFLSFFLFSRSFYTLAFITVQGIAHIIQLRETPHTSAERCMILLTDRLVIRKDRGPLGV